MILIQGHKSVRKIKTSVPVISQRFQLIWIDFGIPLIPVSVMNLILVYLVYLIFKGENPTYVISLKTNKQTKLLH